MQGFKIIKGPLRKTALGYKENGYEQQFFQLLFFKYKVTINPN